MAVAFVSAFLSFAILVKKRGLELSTGTDKLEEDQMATVSLPVGHATCWANRH
jgi:hypothetical protein